MTFRRDLIHYEQAVYGSFPFWDRGYAVLARSPGCRDEWLADLRAACQRIGEPPAGAREARGLFALRLESGPWTIVGINPQGRDDQGRPGALAFHALFVSPREYHRAGSNPFVFEGALRSDWTAETRALPSGVCRVEPIGLPMGEPDARAAGIASALTLGHRVALEATGPIDDLARQVWQALPDRVRARATVATWAFGNGNRFDLVAVPRLASVALDASYVDPQALSERPLSEREAGRFRWRTRRALLYVALAAVGIGVTLGLARRRNEGVSGPPPPASSVPVPPDRAAYPVDRSDSEARQRVSAGLVELAERFGIIPVEADGAGIDPSQVMVMIADRLRYRGRVLSPDELARLARDPSLDRALALRWHDHMRRFLADRPLPPHFAAGPLRWQLDTLAWSFHLDDDRGAPRRSSAEVPHALAEALAVDLPVRPTPLATRYPALADYAAFLGRLPRR